jgi:hypothetical protein
LCFSLIAITIKDSDLRIITLGLLIILKSGLNKIQPFLYDGFPLLPVKPIIGKEFPL